MSKPLHTCFVRPSDSLYAIRIADNAISATAFKAMAAPRKPGEREENETEKGLRVQDKGFLNTAVIRSEITYIDGDAGGGCYHLNRGSYRGCGEHTCGVDSG